MVLGQIVTHISELQVFIASVGRQHDSLPIMRHLNG